jgi:hypothetical protein
VAHGGQGRPISWIAVLIITVGFVAGGQGVCMDPKL